MAEPRLQIVAPETALGDAPALGAITFFYYDDLPRAVAFYRESLGVKVTMVREWCAICELAGGARLGLVDGLHGSQRPIRTGDKGAILSLEVHDLAACFERCLALGLVDPDAQLETGCGDLTLEFKVRDPGGYTVEFFQWKESGSPSFRPR